MSEDRNPAGHNPHLPPPVVTKISPEPAGSRAPAYYPELPDVPTVELDDMTLVDQETIDEMTKDPQRHYRWVYDPIDPKDEHKGQKIASRERRGYTIETYREGGPKPLVLPANQGDGVIRNGDRVLMSCPKTYHDSAVRQLFQRSEKRINSTTNVIKEQASKQNVRLITDSDAVTTAQRGVE